MDFISALRLVTDPSPSSLECSECGVELRPTRVFELGGVRGCIHCCAHRALAILYPEGQDDVSRRDIDEASCILQTAAALLKIECLARMSGVKV